MIAGFLALAEAAFAGGDAAQEAARRAQDKHGGRVLKVERHEDGYRVKLLNDNGRVKTVFVSSAEKKKEKPHYLRSGAPRHSLGELAHRTQRAAH